MRERVEKRKRFRQMIEQLPQNEFFPHFLFLSFQSKELNSIKSYEFKEIIFRNVARRNVGGVVKKARKAKSNKRPNTSQLGSI